MITTKKELYQTLEASIGQPMTEQLMFDVIHFVMSLEQQHANEIANWINNSARLIDRVNNERTD